MPGKITLKVIAGPLRGNEFPFEHHDTFIFGRALDCHAKLAEEDETASRHHFLLEVNPPDARLRDLGSLNGTSVNGVRHGGRDKGESAADAARKRHPEVDLKAGDEIVVGDTKFLVGVELARFCAECGREIPSSDESIAAGEHRWVCSACVKKVQVKETVARMNVAAPQPRETVAASEPPPTCKSCGKDVAREVGGGRRGDYVCTSCQDRVARDPLELLVRQLEATEFPGHVVEKKLGEGGMGAVYLARRKSDGARVALKVMLSRVATDKTARESFLREAGLASQLRHRNLVEFYELGSAGACFFFTMDFCDGGSVDQWMEKRGGKLSLSEAAPIMLQVLDGLAYAHEAEVEVKLDGGGFKKFRGVVHRDLKPQNLLLHGPPGNPTAKITDYGLAKCFGAAGLSGQTMCGQAGGTVAFMPREQVINYRFVKPSSDVWSIAATFYNILTGHVPRDHAPGQDVFAVVLRGEPVPLRHRDSSIPKRVAEVIDRALATKVEDRFATAQELRKALAAAL